MSRSGIAFTGWRRFGLTVRVGFGFGVNYFILWPEEDRGCSNYSAVDPDKQDYPTDARDAHDFLVLERISVQKIGAKNIAKKFVE